MSRRKHTLHPLPCNFPPEDVAVLESRAALLERFLAVRHKVRTRLGSRRWQHQLARARWLHERQAELHEDLYEEQCGLGLRELLVDLVEANRARSLPSGELLLCALVLGERAAGFTSYRRARVGVSRKDELAAIAGHHDGIADECRGTLGIIIADLRAKGRKVARPALDALEDHVLHNADTQQILALIDFAPEREVVEAAFEERFDRGPLCPAEMSASRAYVRALQDRHDHLAKRREHIDDRLELGAEFLTEPAETLLPESQDTFTVVLTQYQLQKYRELLTPDTPSTRRLADRYGELTYYMAYLACSPDFWHVVLCQWLAEFNGITGSPAELAEWVGPLLVNLIEHPQKLRRLKVPRGAERARTWLAKRLAPYLVGASERRPGFIQAELADGCTPAMVVWAAADSLAELADVTLDDPLSTSFNNPRQQTVVAGLWESLFADNAEAILEQLAQQTLERLADEKALEEAFSRFSGFLEAEDAEEEPEDSVPPEDPRWSVANWLYVANPGNPDGSAEPVVSSSDDDAGQVLDAYFRSRHIDPVIKTDSIANALRYYVDMPDAVRSLVPHENVEGESWSKLKRGKIRILARFGDLGKLQFHIYSRKDWRRREA